MTIVSPLYGHESFETAYLVESYPYGSLRCKMWFWLESKPKKGVRLVTQSENPKTGRMNKPHAGTYHKFAANLYLDENGHVQTKAINEYSSAQEVYDFIKAFPANAQMKDLALWCKMKYAYERKCVDQKRSFISINGVEEPLTESEIEKRTGEMRIWWRAFNLTQQKPEDTMEP